MNTLIHNRLAAPGRMDVVEKVLKTEPYFSGHLGKTCSVKNRRGVRKHYSALTVQVVKTLASQGIDAARMRRDEVIARAFDYCMNMAA